MASFEIQPSSSRPSRERGNRVTLLFDAIKSLGPRVRGDDDSTRDFSEVC